MNFTINHGRAFAGNNIYVKVDADPNKPLSAVRTVLDGFELADDSLTEGSVSYERTFAGAGSAGSGTQHTLVVTAELADGTSHSSTSIWTDPI
ncbi:MAG TPA: hypothetical protein VE263_04460 [Candidatus Angelobacter sp.]|nr:hypothetical protein [Candidatus Angelobacter sp.]